jgi:glycosyltransferase involved in cell wall biosynthesis
MKTISVIIPAYNEEKRLPETLKKWQTFLSHNKNNFLINKIFIIDDGSTDKTVSIAESFRDSLPIKIHKISPNQGKGNAVKAGIKNAESDFILIYDADAATPPEELNKLFFETKNADFVIGSRIINGAETTMSPRRKFIGRCFHFLCMPIIPKIKDASCGVKLIKTSIAKNIFERQYIKRFAFDIEILWLAKKINCQIKEIGVKWDEIPGSKVKVSRDSIEMFFSVLSLYKRAILDKIKNKKINE